MDQKELKPVGHIGTEQGWRERRDLLLRQESAHTRIADLIGEAKENVRSLAVFKPTRVTRFESEEAERDWDPKKLESMRAIASQPDLFGGRHFGWSENCPTISTTASRMPTAHLVDFGFSNGRLVHSIGIVSAPPEVTKLRRSRRSGRCTMAIKSDLHFFLGTTLAWHSRAPNPWVIVGVFPIPHERQPDLFAPPGAGSQHS